jgi:hypothetical protein
MIVLASSGAGRTQSVPRDRVIWLYRAFISADRTESRAPAEYPEKDTSPIVPRIARMVMTTTSSMRVKAEDEVFIRKIEDINSKNYTRIIL